MMRLDYAENKGNSTKKITIIFCAALPRPQDFQIPGKNITWQCVYEGVSSQDEHLKQ